MRKGFHDGPQWWPEGEQWPPRRGPGYEQWSGFGRRIFVGFFAIVAMFFLGAALIGALIATGLAGLTELARTGVVVGSLVVLVLGGALVARAIRRTWRPVRSIIGAAGRLADGDYTARANVGSAASMRAVGDSFNTMAERLEEADEQRRRLMSDLSHELRTPLAVIRGEIEAVMDGVHESGPEHLASLLDEVEILERLIEDLRLLTLSESGRLELEIQTTDLVHIVYEVADSYRAKAAARGVEIFVNAPLDLPEVDIDPVRYRQALTNLVTNSLRAMPLGGTLTLNVTEEGTRVTTEVVDTGSGIEPERLDAVFERFEKADTSDGSGLGLSIARGLIRAHGGDLTIPVSGPAGTTATMWVPR